MSGTSLAIVTAAGLSASALVAVCLTPRRPGDGPAPDPAAPDAIRATTTGTAGAGTPTGPTGSGSAGTPMGPTGSGSAGTPMGPTGSGSAGGAVLSAERPPSAPSTPATTAPGARRGVGERLAGSRVVRRSLGALTAVLVIAAGISISWPFWTDQYQHRLQVRLERQLEEQIASPEAVEEFTAGEVETGDSLTRLKMPSIGVDVVVVEGTTQAALRAGAGHYPETALPCGTGNVAIAGHRTTFGKPFNRLDEVPIGAEITLETPVGTCRYRVGAAATVVTPDQVEVVAPTDTPRLTLTTCHPKESARQRLVLQADLVGEPLLDGLGGQTPPDIRGEA